jgi:hypothetical protein
MAIPELIARLIAIVALAATVVLGYLYVSRA